MNGESACVKQKHRLFSMLVHSSVASISCAVSESGCGADLLVGLLALDALLSLSFALHGILLPPLSLLLPEAHFCCYGFQTRKDMSGKCTGGNKYVGMQASYIMTLTTNSTASREALMLKWPADIFTCGSKVIGQSRHQHNYGCDGHGRKLEDAGQCHIHVMH